MCEKMENKFEVVLRAENPVNYTDIKADIIERIVTLKITLKERSKRNVVNLKGRNVLLDIEKEVAIKYQTFVN